MGIRPKRTALIRAFAVMLVAFSATTSLFAGSALAAGACTVDPLSGVVGSTMTVSCTGFSPNETVRIYWKTEPTSPSTPGAKGSFQTDGSGAGSGAIAVPDAVSGSHTVWLFGALSTTKTSTTFTVVPNITTSNTSGAPATSLSAQLTGFPAAESVTVKWYHDATTSVNVKTVTIGALGKASAISTVPDAVAGDHTVEADDGDALTTNPTTTFTVVPSVKVSPTSAKVGNTVTVSVRGYGAAEAVTINWVVAGTPTVMDTTVTNGFGKGTASFVIPQAAMGTYEVQGDGTDNDASTTFPVVPSVDLDFSSYFVHNTVNVALDGYPADTLVTVKWYRTSTVTQNVATATTDANGHAAATFEVPDATRGSHKVEGFVSSTIKPYALATVKPSLEITPATGVDGDDVAVHLHGFNASEAVGIQWFASLSTIVEMDPVTVNGLGTGNGSFLVPVGSTNGNHQVKANGTQDASATFNVDNPPVNQPASCELDRTTGAIGLLVEVSCINYDASEEVNVYWDSTATTALATGAADDNGSYSVDINIPAGSVNGAHAVLTVGGTSAEQTSDAFTVVDGPSCTLSDLNATPGVQGIFDDEISYSCTGFLPNELVRVYWDTTTSLPRASGSADSTGAASGAFSIPTARNGAHTVFIVGNTSKYQTTGTVGVDATMTVAPTSGAVGTSPTVTMKGFGAAETLTLQWLDGTTPVGPAKQTTSASNGGKFITYAVPATPAGAYTLRVTGGTTGEVVTQPFTILASMTLTPTSGTPDSSVDAKSLKILLRGYQPNEVIDVLWTHSGVTKSTLATVTADVNGTIQVSVTVPHASTGEHLVEGIGDAGTVTSSVYTVAPSMVLSRTNGPVGVIVRVTLKGWGVSENVTLNWHDGDTVTPLLAGPVTVSARGLAQVNVVVPETYNGAHFISATGEGATPTTKQSTFNVAASLSLSPATGPAGTTVTVTLKGFGQTTTGAGESVQLRFFTTASSTSFLKNVTVGANGSATTTVVIPASSVANHKIQGTGAESNAKGYTYFRVTS